MAITTFAELQTACATWLVRGDLTARIPDFITLAEARINRVLRARRAEADAALTSTAGVRTIDLPAAYSEALNCWITVTGGTDRQPLRFIDPARLDVSTTSGQPQCWTIDGATLAFERPCDAAYSITLRYLAKFALSDDVPTNPLLTDYPDLYLFGALSEAGPFLRDPDVTGAYEAKFTSAVAEINAKDARSRSQQTLSTEPGQLTRYGRRDGYNIRTDA